MPSASAVLGSFGLADLARMEPARGRADVADRYRRLFEERVDLGGMGEIGCL
jgi:hypothetical protein